MEGASCAWECVLTEAFPHVLVVETYILLNMLLSNRAQVPENPFISVSPPPPFLFLLPFNSIKLILESDCNLPLLSHAPLKKTKEKLEIKLCKPRAV